MSWREQAESLEWMNSEHLDGAVAIFRAIVCHRYRFRRAKLPAVQTTSIKDSIGYED